MYSAEVCEKIMSWSCREENISRRDGRKISAKCGTLYVGVCEKDASKRSYRLGQEFAKGGCVAARSAMCRE